MRAVYFFLKNFANFISFLCPVLEKIAIKSLPMQIETMVTVVSRTGRHLQRYDGRGCRLVVGCIPYRYKKRSTSIDETLIEDLEVLMISSQNGQSMLFPKGGWELDESIEDAASRETLEEAGVIGNIECKLGNWRYMSKSSGIFREGHMFPLLVKQQLDRWPEKNIRKRRWVSVDQAKEVCKIWWMREALDELVRRQMHLQEKLTENKTQTSRAMVGLFLDSLRLKGPMKEQQAGMRIPLETAMEVEEICSCPVHPGNLRLGMMEG